MLYTEFTLDDRLQRALVTAGFVSPTPIQEAAIPVAMSGRDLVGTAQTGTGKTAAFVLPILQHLIAIPMESRRTRAVILAPTRELVEQILAVVRELGIHTNIRAVAVYGGIAMQPQTRALRNGVDLVVACPGRLLDHINRRNTDFRQLDYLVMDEADRMLDMGFMPSIEEIIAAMPIERQTMLFSATFPKKLNTFVAQTLKDPARVEVDTAVAAQTVQHTLYQVKGSLKINMLKALLHKIRPESDSVLIFTRTRVGANEVAGHLHAIGMRADVLHAEKTQRARQDTLDQFRAGIFPYLVATDIAARGIDVTSISHVINYDLPTKPDDYLHRIGRTGRMERTGQAISLMTRGDIRAVREIERMLGKRIDIALMDDSDYQLAQDAQPIVQHANEARPPKHQLAARPTNHPLTPHHHQVEEEFPRRAPRSAPPEHTPRANRPQSARQHDAPSGERSRRMAQQAEVAPSAPARTERPQGRRMDAAPSRDERPQRRRDAEAPAARGERPARSFSNDRGPARPPRTERAERRYRDADAPPPARGERPAKPFNNDRAGGRPPRPERGERSYRDGDAPAPKRRERLVVDHYAAMEPAEAPRAERTGRKQFSGMAATVKHRRKSAAKKRHTGEIPPGPRPQGKAGTVPRTKRPHRGR